MYDSARVLLNNGVEGTPEEWNDLLEWYSIKESSAVIVNDDLELQNIWYVMYELIDAYRNGGGVKDYRLFYDIIGQRINGVFAEERLTIDSDGNILTDKFVALACDDGNLWFEGRPNLIARMDELPETMCDNSELFRSVIGTTIAGFRFDIDTRQREPQTTLTCGITYVDLSDGTMLLFTKGEDTKFKQIQCLPQGVPPRL